MILQSYDDICNQLRVIEMCILTCLKDSDMQLLSIQDLI